MQANTLIPETGAAQLAQPISNVNPLGSEPCRSVAPSRIQPLPGKHLKPVPTWMDEANGGAHSNLTSFFVALTMFVLMTVGLLAIGWGTLLASVSLATAGFLATLVATFLHAWSLREP